MVVLRRPHQYSLQAMKKVLVQLLVIAAIFTAVWFALSRIDWVSVLKVKERSQSTEEKLGKLIWDNIRSTETEIHSKTINNAVDTLVNHICEANSIARSKLRVHILKKDDINAFALPDNQLIIYSGLIE